MSPNETLFLESTNKIIKEDISNSSFVKVIVLYNLIAAIQIHFASSLHLIDEYTSALSSQSGILLGNWIFLTLSARWHMT